MSVQDLYGPASELSDLIPKLTAWFAVNARPLPWRAAPEEAPDPYHVWVSEIMLQQTRIEAVKRYYARFMKALPTVGDLAACEENKLLKLWEGLGYYNRVRNMQKAAGMVMEQHQGKLPPGYAELLRLPGFGPYTAGAVASICFHEPVCAVDGNVLRVFARLRNDDSDVLDPKTKRTVERLLMYMFKGPAAAQQEAPQIQSGPGFDPGVFNQSLMELGETVCVPGASPHCEVCPVQHICKAYRYGTQAQLPVRIKKTKRRIEQKTVLVICDRERTVLRRRSGSCLLAGFYELPSLPGHVSSEEVLEWLRDNQIRALRIRSLPPAKHLFTHVEWQMTGFYILAEELEFPEGTEQTDEHAGETDIPDCFHEKLFAVSPALLEEQYPIPGAFASYASWIDVRVGSDRLDNGTEEQEK